MDPHIDDAYPRKYAASPYLQPMLAAGPRAASIEIQPRAAYRAPAGTIISSQLNSNPSFAR